MPVGLVGRLVMLHRILPVLLITALSAGAGLSYALDDDKSMFDAVCDQAEGENTVLQAIAEVEAINKSSLRPNVYAGHIFQGTNAPAHSGSSTVSAGLNAPTKAPASR